MNLCFLLQKNAHFLVLSLLTPVVVGCSQHSTTDQTPSGESTKVPSDASVQVARWTSAFTIPAKITRDPDGRAFRPTPGHKPPSMPFIGAFHNLQWNSLSESHVQAAPANTGALNFELPKLATGAVKISDQKDGLALSFRLENPPTAQLDTTTGYAVYSNPKISKHWLHRISPNSLEDFVIFDAAPVQEQLVYRLDISRVPGLRFVSGILELLDSEGTPRLRVSAPWIVDNAHKRIKPTFEVEGCAYDTSPAGPWNRPLTQPNSQECTLRISWSGKRPIYPIAVDPSWASTGSMTVARDSHVAARLTSGRVLVCGGTDTAEVHASCEVYDPLTATWAATSDMSAPKWGHKAILVPDGRVFIIGGNNENPMAIVDIYDPNTGKIAAGPAMFDARSGPSLALLKNSKPPLDPAILVSGGEQASAPGQSPAAIRTSEVFNIAAGTWSKTDNLPGNVSWHDSVLLPNGDVFTAGGLDNNNASIDGVSVYSRTAMKWAAKTAMPEVRRYHQVIQLADGRVLLSGGKNNSGKALNTAVLYDPQTDTFAPAPPLPEPKSWAPVVVAGTNKVFAIGGDSDFWEKPTANVAVLDLTTNKFLIDNKFDLPGPRLWNTATALDPSRILVVGGYVSDSDRLDTAMILRLDPNKTPCVDSSKCESGFCVDGVCCNEACAETCKSCSEAKKNMAPGDPGDGFCGPSKAGLNAGCSTQATFTCGNNGTCDGKGACGFHPIGTTCNSCSDGKHSVGTCAGPNTCQSSQPVPCSPYICADAFNCNTSCATDNDCAANAFCRTSDKTCQLDLPAGSVCNAVSQCQSNFCVDGVCCNEACTHTCSACTAKLKGKGEDGICEAVVAGIDPKDSCKDDGSPSCIHNGLCDGLGACQNYPSSQQCSPNGCSVNAQCSSNFCVEGICCNKECTGSCEACTVAMKGTGTEGLCENIAADRDPKDKCGKSSLDCKSDGLCNGSGQCREVSLPDTSCGTNQCTGIIASRGSCDDHGNCEPIISGCSPFACLGTTCAPSCSEDSHCAPGHHCKSAQCLPDLTDGTTCALGHECKSGNCVDKVCCNAKCEGQCQACNLPNHLGDCNPVTGVPQGGRPKCENLADAGTCGQKTCDGKATTGCVFVGDEILCRAETCLDGIHTQPASCDGKSSCKIEQSVSCAQFACGAYNKCKTTCTTDTDCATKFKCELSSGNCIPRTIECKNGQLIDPNGTSISCAPYRCGSDACKSSCTSGADCVDNYQCDNGSCVLLETTDSPVDSGCGCRLVGSSTPHKAYFLPFILVGGLFVRRRHSRNAKRTTA